MSNPYNLLVRLAEACQDRITEEDREDIISLAEIYQPYEGDDAEEAKKRQFLNARCGNCEFSFPVMPMPSELGRAARSSLRHAACPRCFSNTNIFVSG